MLRGVDESMCTELNPPILRPPLLVFCGDKRPSRRRLSGGLRATLSVTARSRADVEPQTAVFNVGLSA